MKSSEEAIERVMAGLREASASPGIEGRILEAVEGRASVRSRSGWQRLWPVWLSMPTRPVAGRWRTYGAALACMLVVALVLPSMYRFTHGRTSAKVRTAGAAFPPSPPSGLMAKSPQISQPRSNVRSMGKIDARKTRLVQNTDSETLHELRATGYPAPPMPLTEQERLLLRLVHAGDPVELAMLNPEIRARREAEDEAEFERFFPPPATVDNE